MTHTKLLDKEFMDITDKNSNMLVPWFLMAAYAYYVQDDPILSDSTFDRMCRKMLDEWDTIEHMHKDMITKSELESGTFLGEYPSRVEGAIKQLKEAVYGK